MSGFDIQQQPTSDGTGMMFIRTPRLTALDLVLGGITPHLTDDESYELLQRIMLIQSKVLSVRNR